MRYDCHVLLAIAQVSFVKSCNAREDGSRSHFGRYGRFVMEVSSNKFVPMFRC